MPKKTKSAEREDDHYGLRAVQYKNGPEQDNQCGLLERSLMAHDDDQLGLDADEDQLGPMLTTDQPDTDDVRPYEDPDGLSESGADGPGRAEPSLGGLA